MISRYKNKGCSKCKDRSVLMKKTCKHEEPEKTIKGFDLAQKYLTEEGQK
jgi:hypothetical protein